MQDRWFQFPNQFFVLFPLIYSHQNVIFKFLQKLVSYTYSPELTVSTLNSRNPLIEYKKDNWGPCLMFFFQEIPKTIFSQF